MPHDPRFYATLDGPMGAQGAAPGGCKRETPAEVAGNPAAFGF
jgi:hypothetical protein